MDVKLCEQQRGSGLGSSNARRYVIVVEAGSGWDKMNIRSCVGKSARRSSYYSTCYGLLSRLPLGDTVQIESDTTMLNVKSGAYE